MSESEAAEQSAASAPEPESGASVSESMAPHSGPRSQPLAEGQRRRSSIRPVSPDWRPPSRSSGPPRPMVVVYSGDNQGPPLEWDAPASQAPETDRSTPLEPFLLPRDVPLPSIPDFEALAPPMLEASPEAPRAANDGVPSFGAEPVPAFDGQPVAAYAPEEIDALVAYELARAEFRAELETPSVRREVRPHVPIGPPPPEAPPPAAVVAAPKASARSRGAWPLVGGGIVLGVALAGALSLRPGAAAPEREAKGPEALTSSKPADVLAEKPAVAPAAPVSAPVPSSASDAALAASGASAELDPARKSTHVVLEVLPIDARVMWRGTKRRGPPYEFDVPRGRRVTVEVARKGYVTRKVVLDGRVSSLMIGLTPDKRAGRGAGPGDGGGAPGMSVRSGL